MNAWCLFALFVEVILGLLMWSALAGYKRHGLVPAAFVLSIGLLWRLATAIHARYAALEPMPDRRAESREQQMLSVIAMNVVHAVTRKAVAIRRAAAASTADLQRAAVQAAQRAGPSTREAGRATVENLQSLRTGFEVKDDRDYERVEHAVCTTSYVPTELDGLPFALDAVLRGVPEQERNQTVKRQRDLVARVRPVFTPLLENGESILYATRGARPFSVIDYLAAIAFFYVLRRCIYIFTDRRVFLIPISWNGLARPSVSAVRFADIKGFRFDGGYGFTVNMKIALMYANRRGENFNRIPIQDFRRLETLLGEWIAAAPVEIARPLACRQRVYFCRFCGSEMRPGIFRCRTCGATYRTRRETAFFAATLPGGGYFCSEHIKLGTFYGIIETLLFVNLIGLCIAIAGSFSTYARFLTIYAGLLVLGKLVHIQLSMELASEYVPKRVPKSVGTPRLSMPVSAGSRAFDLGVLTIGIALTVLAIGMRLPVYAKQRELLRMHPALHRRAAALYRLSATIRQVRGELRTAASLLEYYDGFRETENRYSVVLRSFPPYRVIEFDANPELNAHYQEALRRFDVAYARYGMLVHQLDNDAAVYDGMAEHADALRAEIGDVWFSVTPDEVVLDLHARLRRLAGDDRSLMPQIR